MPLVMLSASEPMWPSAMLPFSPQGERKKEKKLTHGVVDDCDPSYISRMSTVERRGKSRSRSVLWGHICWYFMISIRLVRVSCDTYFSSRKGNDVDVNQADPTEFIQARWRVSKWRGSAVSEGAVSGIFPVKTFECILSQFVLAPC